MSAPRSAAAAAPTRWTCLKPRYEAEQLTNQQAKQQPNRRQILEAEYHGDQKLERQAEKALDLNAVACTGVTERPKAGRPTLLPG